MEGLDVLEEIPEEIVDHLGTVDQTPLECEFDRVRYDSSDDIVDGSKEEDEEISQLTLGGCGGIQDVENCPHSWNFAACGPRGPCTWTNGFLEHFWNPDAPSTAGFDCGLIAGGYNQGLHGIDGSYPFIGDLGPANAAHYDSSYRVAQFYWDHLVLPLYRTGSARTRREAYYWLGRVAHLLEDLTVPAHVHDDPHGPLNCDSYEDSFKTADGPNDIYAYRGEDYRGEEYRIENLPNLGGFDWQQVHPYEVPPSLFKLFYFTAQRTQYASSDEAGGEPHYYTLDGTQRTFSPSLWAGAGPGGVGVVVLAAHLIPHALRAVGGLYRLFWEANHPPWITPPPTTVTSGDSFSVAWKVVDGETFGHTNVHYDTIDDLDPATCLSRASCRSTAQVTGAVGQFEATITAPSVTSPTTYFMAVHAEIAGYDVMGEPIAVQVLPPAAAHAISITAGPSGSPNLAASGGAVQMTVSASDTRGHALTYSWSAACPGLANGSFNVATSRTPTWTAPSNQTGATRFCTLQVVITDGLGLSETRTVSQGVSAVPATHAINLTVPPTGSPNPLIPAARARLAVAAADSLGHSLSYSWRVACPGLASAGELTGTLTQTPEWTAPQNATGSEQSCTLTVTITDNQGLSRDDSYVHRVSPGGVTSLAISDGLRLVEAPPYPLSGTGTIDATIENVGTATLLIDHFRAIGTFVAGFGSVFERTWPAANFSPPLSLAPGQTYRYTRLLAEQFPGVATTATVAMHVKFNNVPGQPPAITNAEAGATSQHVFEVGHGIDVTGGPDSDSNPVPSGALAVMQVNAADTLNHPLTYLWTATCPWAGSNGTFSNPTERQPTWTAPPNASGAEQACTISLALSDTRGATASRSYAQKVSSIPHTLTLVSGPVSSTDPCESGSATEVTAGAFDSLGHGLTFEWDSECADLAGDGSFGSLAGASTTWTAPQNLTGSTKSCSLRVTVRDGTGASAQGVVSQEVSSREHAIAVAVSPEPAEEPLAPGDEVDLAVEGVDSLGHALEYTWSANCPDLSSDGEFSAGTGPATTWTSPENSTDGVRSCTIEAALDDGLGLTRVVSITQPVALSAPIPTPTPEPGPTTGHTPDPQVTPSPGPTQAPSGLFVETSGWCGGNMSCFSTLQGALDAASSGGTIRIATGMFSEGVSVSRPELGSVTIEAGWNAAFTERGAPALTISSQSIAGRSVVPSLTIEQGTVEIR